MLDLLGMFLQVITLFVVPVLYAIWKEWELDRKQASKPKNSNL